MKYPEVELILDEMYELVNESTILTGTVYESVEELEEDLLNYIEEMRDNSGQWTELLDMHFKKESTFALLDQHNAWGKYEEWMERYKAAKK